MKKSLRFVSVFLSLVLTMALLAPISLAAGFPDTANNWAKKYIDSGVKAGYISGYKDGTFRPNNTVTRGAFCKIVNQALGLQAMADISFSDVKSGDTFYAEIRKGVYAGYISGYTDGTFRPAATITRQQAAAMLSRILPAPTSPKQLSTLKDQASVADYARDGVQSLISKGYLTADSKGNFAPAGPMTRAQTAATVGKALEGEKIIRGAVSFTTAGKTYSNNLYVGPLTVSIAAPGAITFSNCRLMGTLTVKSGAAVRLADTHVTALTVNSAAAPTVTAAGTTDIVNTYLASGANLTESGLTGTGFNAVALNGTTLKSAAVALRGKFSSVSALSPVSLALASGSVTALNVSSGAAGSVFALASGTAVGTATLNGACSFTGAGTIAAAVQNVSDVTYQTTPVSLSGSAASSLTVSATPSNGSKNVAVTSDIKLKFSEAVYSSAGKSLTASDIVRNVAELRRGSATGTSVSFTASISSDKKTITLTPEDALRETAVYYVILAAGELRTSSGAYNARQVFSFTTGSDTLVPTVSPSNGSDGVSVSVNPTLTFSEAVFRSNEGSVTASYLESSVLELRKSSESGTKISFSASINSSKKTVTITPDDSLASNTKYYIIVKADSLYNADGDSNDRLVFYFDTTGGGTLAATPSPANGKTGVSVGSSITLTFGEAVFRTSGKTLSSSYLEDSVIELRKKTESGTSVAFSASINSKNKIITIQPDSELAAGTKYYVVLLSKSLANGDGDTNSRQVFYFTTGEDATPTVSIYSGASGVSVNKPTVTLRFSESVSLSYASRVSQYVALYKGTSSASSVGCTVSFSNDSRYLYITATETLSYNSTYNVFLSGGYFKNGDGTTVNDSRMTFTTEAQPVALTVDTPTPGYTDVAGTFTCGAAGNAVVTLNGGSAQTITVTANQKYSYSFNNLTPGTDYTVSVTPPSGSAAAKSFRTKTPTVSLSAVLRSDGSGIADVTVSSTPAGAITLACDKGGTLDVTSFASGSGSAVLSGLSVGTSYTVTAILTYGGTTFSNTAGILIPSSETGLQSLSVIAGGSTKTLTDSDTECSLTIVSGTEISFEATATDSNARCRISPTVIAPAASGDSSVTVTVTAQDGTTRDYAFTLHVTVEEPAPVVPTEPAGSGT